jgi:wobble nucleotide-excising tRNase
VITKVRHLKSIGRFYNLSSNGCEIEWGKQALVFAPNAYGKSTLVSVSHSLRDNNPSLVRARKTPGAKEHPEATITVDAAARVFSGTGWNKSVPSIQVFNEPFIHAKSHFAVRTVRP